MQGFYQLIKPDTGPGAAVALTAPPELEQLKEWVGGWIELVPYFNEHRFDGERHRCIALCNEEGKIHNLPFNKYATHLWAQCMEGRGSTPHDALMGTVVILWGDAAFMAEL